jgi:ATP-binding cassette, subfamily C, bacterial exporter for protease/lipase
MNAPLAQPLAPGAKAPDELADALRGLKPYYLRATLFSLLAAALVLAPSWYMWEVYGRVVNSRSHMTLWMLTAVVLGAYVLMEVLEAARARVMHDASLALDAKLATRVFDAVFVANLKRLPLGATPMNDLRVVRDFLHAPPLLAIMEAPIALVLLVLISMISPWLGVMALVFALLQAAVTWANERSTQPPLAQSNRAAIAAQQYADGSLRNAQVIEAMGMLNQIHRRWLMRQRVMLGAQAQASEAAGLYQAMGKFLQITLGSAMLGGGVWLLMHNQINGGAGMMMVASILGGRVLAPMTSIVAQWQLVVNARESYKRLSSVLAQIPAPGDAMRLPAPRGVLTVEGVIAAPPNGGAPILRGVSFAAQPGEVVAVVGPSASGKTTLARLLTGLWPAIQGKVRLDGVDVFTWNKAELGPHVGYLPQGIELFDGSIADNIARFGEPDRARVEAAARAVGVHDIIASLTDGYDTDIGVEGAVLSGGQRQRVALARALYGSPTLVVLDEPNSNLDEAGDLALNQAIAAASQRGATVIVITHRTSVLSVTHKLLVLRDGAVASFGPRDQVLAALQQAQQPQAPAVPVKSAQAATNNVATPVNLPQGSAA